MLFPTLAGCLVEGSMPVDLAPSPNLRGVLFVAIVVAMILGTPILGALIATPLAVVAMRDRPFSVACRWPLAFGFLQGALLYAVFVAIEWRKENVSWQEWLLFGLFTFGFGSVFAGLHALYGRATFALLRRFRARSGRA
jgi:hypothetical protein